MLASEWKDDGETVALEELVARANRVLPRYWPAAVGDARVRDEVNPRLVRHLATLGVLDEALREGREARYTRRHLLQLLAARRLMAEGYTTGAVRKLTAHAADAELEALLQGGAQLSVNPSVSRAADVEATLERKLLPPDAPGAALDEEAKKPKASNAALDFLRGVRARSGSVAGEVAPRHAPSPSLPPSQPPVPPSQPPVPWVRVEIAPGLELHVRDDWALPPTPHERDELLSRIWLHLTGCRSGKGRYRSSQRRAKP